MVRGKRSLEGDEDQQPEPKRPALARYYWHSFLRFLGFLLCVILLVVFYIFCSSTKEKEGRQKVRLDMKDNSISG